MIRRREVELAKGEAIALLSRVSIALTQIEIQRMEVVDFGLSDLANCGVQIVPVVETGNIAVRLLVLTPHQTEPEHRHPALGQSRGKEEVIRCEWGELYLYGPGNPTFNPKGRPPLARRATYTVWHEHILHPGGQVAFQPNTPHWFQAGPGGAVIWSFSTKALDLADEFTDPDIVRCTVIVDDGHE